MFKLIENEKEKEKLAYICHRFRIPGELIIYRRIHTGHINTAFYVAVYNGVEVQQLLIQKVNTYVFKDPSGVMSNIELITGHIRNKDPLMERRRRLHFRHTDEGKNYLELKDENGETEFWRLYNYVENSISVSGAEGDVQILKMAGIAFGRFMRQLEDFDASQLMEPIPHFHDTRYRLNTFFADVARDPIGRVPEVKEEIDFIAENREFGSTLCRMIDEGKLPLRVTHNDTKTDNVLFDVITKDPIVIVDLDTCMPGLACYDFGDTIRFAACTADEDEKDTSKMKLNMDRFRAYAEGYLSQTGDVLTEEEIGSLAVGAAVITLELASRFLDDYITGDRYFRIDYPAHNLVRARAQLALFKDMMAHMDEMQSAVRELAPSR